MLLTRNELEDLIAMLRSLQGNADLSELETNELMSFLEPLPDKVPMDPALKFKECKNTKQSTPNPGSSKEDNSPLAAMIAKRQVLSNRYECYWYYYLRNFKVSRRFWIFLSTYTKKSLMT